MQNLLKPLHISLGMLYNFLLGWLIDFIKLMRHFGSRRKQKKILKCERQIYAQCQPLPPTVYKRPDPLIYSQSFLMAQGLAVTWDNPDIQLYHNGVAVSSSALLPNTKYRVEATIYNGSTDAPAVNMDVEFSFLSFGIGTTSTKIGHATVDLPVKGAPGHPAKASMNWHTPATAGHYCLQVKLNWADDANPQNNLGQENTNVGLFHSPAVFEFPLRNASEGIERLFLEADTYTIPSQLIDCRDVVNGRLLVRDEDRQREISGQALCDYLADLHRQGDFPIPEGWEVIIDPQELELPPDHQQLITVTITAPDTFTGVRAFNVNAYNDRKGLVGGVTLYVQR